MRRYLFFVWLALTHTMATAQTLLPISDSSVLSPGQHIILTADIVSDAQAIIQAQELAARIGAEVEAIWPLAAIDEICYVLRLATGEDLRSALETMRQDPAIRTAQRLREFEVMEVNYADDLLPIQDSLKKMNVQSAHRISTGANVTIALIDSAVDTSHADLNNQDILTRDMVNASSGTAPAERHGTAMAAIIAADARNRSGMIGIAPDARLMALRACWAVGEQSEKCNSFTLARALNFAILNEADIINLSLGGPVDPLIEGLLNVADDSGILVVAAHGPSDTPKFPASIETVLVASQHPKDAALVVPSQDVISAVPGGRYDFFSGDSVASAQVSSLAALLLQLEDKMSPSDIRDSLAGSVGRGDLNACSVLQVSRPQLTQDCQ